MMYSFSDEPGRASALNKWLSSCSVKGAISEGVILKKIFKNKNNIQRGCVKNSGQLTLQQDAEM